MERRPMTHRAGNVRHSQTRHGDALRRLHLSFVKERYPVTIATGSHLFPSRTQQLSPSAPMVLPWQRGGRVGHCRVSLSSYLLSFGTIVFRTEEITAPRR